MSSATIEYKQKAPLRFPDQDVTLHPPKVTANSLDMTLLTQIVDSRMMTITQQFQQDQTSKIEDLLDLDTARTDELWNLDLDSVRRLKGTSLSYFKRVPSSLQAK